MDDTNLIALLQKSFHVTLGATAALMEALQDPQKREETLARLRLDFNDLAQDWAAQGAVTESEARMFVNNLFHQTSQQSDIQDTAARTATQETAATSMQNLGIQSELQSLTAQLAAIRAELEKLNQSSQD
jgi:polyhydroxyalkanoate synthesis regulator phasin